jgi:hypothetical protein
MEKVSSVVSSTVIQSVTSLETQTLFLNNRGIQLSKTQSTMEWIGFALLSTKDFMKC